jgi:phage terminase large subunit-like protein
MSPADAEAVLWDWSFWGRDHQRLPPGDWRIWNIRSGRGGGKTRSGAEAVREWAMSGLNRQILIAGRTADDVRSYQIEGPSGLLSVHPNHERPLYEPSLRQLTWPNGTVGKIRYGNEPDGFRGFEGQKAWLDELYHWVHAEESYDNLLLGMREVGDMRIAITSSPLPSDLCKTIAADPDTFDVSWPTDENAVNLNPEWLAMMRRRFKGTSAEKQELEGQILDSSPGALWTIARINLTRVDIMPALVKIVVAVDPAETYGPKSDETGIVVAGLGVDGCAYILEDLSGRHPVEMWPSIAAAAFHRWHANFVVLEPNAGGDMAVSTLRGADRNLPIVRVHAKHGKRTRAEPVALMAEQGRVRHVGFQPALENQLVSVDFVHKQLDDRFDAMVYAVTWLAVDKVDLLDGFRAAI